MHFHRALRRDSTHIIAPFVRVGTYPTRNFALVVVMMYFYILHVAMEIGLYLPAWRVRRIVSEDSRRGESFLLIVSVVQSIAHWNFREFPAYSRIFFQNLLAEANRRRSYTSLRQLVFTLGPL